MAFALTSFVADGIRFMGPGPYRATQRYSFTITGAATDTDLDVGDATGTFWTAAQADATYGAMATQALSRITDWVANYQFVTDIFMPELYDRLQVASGPTGTQYTATIESATLLPTYGFAASGGETSYALTVDYLLDPGMLPNNIAFNVEV